MGGVCLRVWDGVRGGLDELNRSTYLAPHRGYFCLEYAVEGLFKIR